MNRSCALVLAAFLLLALPLSASRADVPSFMHFQGVLTDDEGLPLSEAVDMVFRIYADTTLAAIWTDTFNGVAVVNGFYEVTLNVETLDFDEPYFVGIEVEGSPLGPKKPLATVPYSLRSGKVRVTAGEGLAGTSDSMGVHLSIAGAGVTNGMVADGSITESKIADGSIGTTKILNESITEQKIVNGAVTETKIADGSIAEGKLGTAAVSAGKIAPNTVVRSINGLTDSVTLVAGNQITISPLTGDTIEISASVSGEASDDDWVVDGNDMHSQPSGNVGIGTASPVEKLHVTGGSIRTDGVLIATVGTGTPPLTVESTSWVANLNADYLDDMHAADFAAVTHDHDASAVTSGTIDINRLPVGNNADEVAAGNHTHATAEDGDWNISGNDISLAVSGNVGIGPASPNRKLEIETSASADGIDINNTAATGDPELRFLLSGTPKYTIGVDDSDSDKLKIGGSAVGTNTWMTIDSGGDVGVGTSSPDADLHILESGSVDMKLETTSGVEVELQMKTGAAIYDYLLIEKHGPYAAGSTAGIPLAMLSHIASGTQAGPLLIQAMADTCIYFATDLTERMRITSTGNIGIGTEEPEELLEVAGTVKINPSDSYGHALEVYNPNFTSGQLMALESGADLSNAIDMLEITVTSGSNASCQFIECARGLNTAFKVNADGNVYADGSFTGPADFSEMIRVATGAATVEPGDVMVVDAGSDRSIVKSNKPRSTLVAGIYSTKPGFVGSERDWDDPANKTGDENRTYEMKDMAVEFDEIPLAIVGIVPCKVSAENGSIAPGDLLVTSDTPGHAMRDDGPKVGTVVGKALGSLQSGTGVIRVLVTLH